MRWVINRYFDGGGLVLKLLVGDVSVIVVKEFKYGWENWCDLSCDGVAKGGKIFVVDNIDNMFDENSLEK